MSGASFIADKAANSAKGPELEKNPPDLSMADALPRITAKKLPEALVPDLTGYVRLSQPVISDQSFPEEEDRNPIFDVLVQGENDVPGLLAYALYKQNKRDWLIAFQATNNRIPNSEERAAFILSERIPRRTATYRRLAEDMLAREEWRKSPSKSGLFTGLTDSAANDTGLSPDYLPPPSKRAQTIRYIVGMLLLVIAMAILFRITGQWLFGTPGR